jgi:hypothetical protein
MIRRFSAHFDSRPHLIENAKQLGRFTKIPNPGYLQRLVVRLRALDLRLESRQVQAGTGLN